MNFRFFEIAKKIAEFSTHKQHRIGAAVVKKNRIISLGFNQLKTHPKSPHEYRSHHGEFDAIRKCNPTDVFGSTIYVSRSKKNGGPAMARPCPSCYNMLKELGVKTICYTTDGSYASEEL